MRSVEIWIPSLNRCGSVHTLKAIPNDYLGNVCIAVQEHDVQQYKAMYSPSVNVVQCPLQGIHNVRQWIMETTHADVVIFMSDDLKFYHRGKLSESGTYHHLVDNDMKENGDMIDWMVNSIGSDVYGHAHVGISPRQFNRMFPILPQCAKEIDRMHDCYAYDVVEFNNNRIRFDRVKVMEDMDVTLQLLSKGFPNLVSYYFAWNQSGSNKAGGCSTYRTCEIQAEAAEQMAKLWPDFVKVVEKKVKGWGPMNVRKDIRVQWKKAFNSYVGK